MDVNSDGQRHTRLKLNSNDNKTPTMGVDSNDDAITMDFDRDNNAPVKIKLERKL